MCYNLINQIISLSPVPVFFVIVDDGSKQSYEKVEERIKNCGKYVRLEKHRGKANYYQVMDRLFLEAMILGYDYVMKFDDDVELHPHIFTLSLPILQHLEHKYREVGINYYVDHRADTKVWTPIAPQTVKEDIFNLRRVGWIDGGNWILNAAAMDKLEWRTPPIMKSWQAHPGFISSGVGKALSIGLWGEAVPIFMLMEAHVYHGQHKSVMHPTLDSRARPVCMDRKPWEV